MRRVRRADPAPRAGGSARRYRLATMVLLLSAVAIGCGSDPAPRRHVVEMTAFTFSPETVSAAVGDTVVWVNQDVVPHTATARGARWDSDVVGASGTWQLVMSEPGEMSYECTLHPSMTGEIVVRAVGGRR